MDITTAMSAAREAGRDRATAIRMHPATIRAISENTGLWAGTRAAGEVPALGTPVLSDPSVPVGEFELDHREWSEIRAGLA